ncbi:serine hydrolase domain-containing protein [Rubricoccus marinus]|uniref:Beta-lactamase-related domain-containing protein n=1 Tax=Rubricoccus marinus TaxID=716817 RepID=A0A259TVQ3_9BACT|nr:serine hydrolase domain-containing protein [Rubricoccus marinus]OZC01786.1 hypothetical protein BSZ36_01555 [Rubricoccus marinus]
MPRQLLARRLALLLFLFASGASAQPATLDVAVERARAIADSAARGLPGMAIAVSVDGATVWSEGFGLADLEQRVPVTTETRFRIASVSKPMTAVAVAQLVEAGALDVDAPVQTYVPAFPEKRWAVTTRALGGHLAGIRHYQGDEYFLARPFGSVGEALTVFSADTLMYAPGTAYAYSSYGWNLISAVVEGASGEPFLNYMERRVFAPLGMAHTAADQPSALIPNRARPYERQGEAFANAPYVDNSVKWAGGGFLSTPEDLLRLGAYVTADTLGTRSRALLFTEQTTASGEGVSYGFGWALGTDARGRDVVSHSGGAVGGTSLLWVVPEAGVVVAAAMNLTGADLAWVREIAAVIADAADAD